MLNPTEVISAKDIFCRTTQHRTQNARTHNRTTQHRTQNVRTHNRTTQHRTQNVRTHNRTAQKTKQMINIDIQLIGRYVIINQSISTIYTASRCKKIDLLEGVRMMFQYFNNITRKRVCLVKKQTS